MSLASPRFGQQLLLYGTDTDPAANSLQLLFVPLPPPALHAVTVYVAACAAPAKTSANAQAKVVAAARITAPPRGRARRSLSAGRAARSRASGPRGRRAPRTRSRRTARGRRREPASTR